jgi:hypothetical protein
VTTCLLACSFIISDIKNKILDINQLYSSYERIIWVSIYEQSYISYSNHIWAIIYE